MCPSAALAENGSFVASDVAGVPLLADRGKDGAAGTFHNSCRHRDMILTEGIGDASKIIRRYHAWTYGLDGNLLHVLGNEDFPN